MCRQGSKVVRLQNDPRLNHLTFLVSFFSSASSAVWRLAYATA